MSPSRGITRTRIRPAAVAVTIALLSLGILGILAALLLPAPAVSQASPASVAVPRAADVRPAEAASPEPAPPRDEDSPAPLDGGHECRGQAAFTEQTPALTNLDPALLDALRCASDAAAAEGIFFTVNSGWRTPEEQQRLLDEAITQHGSLEQALRWAATPESSRHVTGEAVDLDPPDAAAWLSEHGAAYGLCQIYVNETWHFELRPSAVTDGCPEMYLDPTEDPRMQ